MLNNTSGRRPFEASRLQAFRQRTDFPESGQDYHPAVVDEDGSVAAPVEVLPGGLHPLDVTHKPSRRGAFLSLSGPTQSLTRTASSSLAGDALYPDHLQQCDYLSPLCKDFVRSLLVPDVSATRLKLYGNVCKFCELMPILYSIFAIFSASVPAGWWY